MTATATEYVEATLRDAIAEVRVVWEQLDTIQRNFRQVLELARRQEAEDARIDAAAADFQETQVPDNPCYDGTCVQCYAA